MQLHPYDIPFFLVLFLFPFFAVFLFFNPKGRKLSNVLLGSFFLSIGLNLFDGYCLYKGIYNYYPHAAFWFNGLPALLGPLLYLYSKSVLFKDFRLKWSDLWHALLYLITLLIFLFIYHLHPVEHKLFFLEQAKIYTGYEIILGNIVLILQLGIYLLLAFRETKLYEKAILQRYSSVENRQLSWLRFTLIGYGFLYVYLLIYSVARFTIWEGEINIIAINSVSFAFLAFITIVIFRVLSHSEIFESIKKEDTKKYAYSNLSDAEAKKYYKELLRIMEQEKPWLNPKLSISDLAGSLEISPKILSQIINSTTRQSFFDFINSRRIEAAKNLLKNPRDDKMTVSEIMYEVGFNSKSSFHTFFKKYVGKTPTEYKNDSKQ